jgi:hypothetical protein
MTTIAYPDPLRQFFQFVETHPELSQRQIAAHFKIGQATVSRRLDARANVPVNGTEPSVPPEYQSTPTALERTIVKGEPVSALSEYPSAPAYYHLQHQVDQLQQQVDVLTAFMSTLQQHPTYDSRSTPRVPEYTAPQAWKKSGVEYAVDMPNQLRAYAKAHGMQVREVVGLALRRLFTEGVAPHA